MATEGCDDEWHPEGCLGARPAQEQTERDTRQARSERTGGGPGGNITKRRDCCLVRLRLAYAPLAYGCNRRWRDAPWLVSTARNMRSIFAARIILLGRIQVFRDEWVDAVLGGGGGVVSYGWLSQYGWDGFFFWTAEHGILTHRDPYSRGPFRPLEMPRRTYSVESYLDWSAEHGLTRT